MKLVIRFICLINLGAVSAQDVIEITADKASKGTSGTYTSTRIQDREENKSAGNVAEVLEKQSGIVVNKYGAPGTRSTLSIRGSNANQVGVYVDGIRMNSAIGGPVNLEDLPLELFSEVEVYRSITPMHLPGTHIGGAVNLTPQLPKKGRYLFTKSKATSLQGGSLGVGFANPHTLQYAQVKGSRNKYKFTDDNGTPFFNKGDDFEKEKQNEDFRAIGYTSVNVLKTKKSKHQLLVDYSGKEQGLPGVQGQEALNVRYKRHLGLLSYQGEMPLFRTMSLILSAGGRLVSSRLQDPEFELAAGFQTQERLHYALSAAASPTLYFFKDKLIVQTNHAANYLKLSKDTAALAERAEFENGSNLEFKPISWLGRVVVSGKLISTEDRPLNNLQSTGSPRSQTLPSGFVHAGLFPILMLNKLRGQRPHKKRHPWELFALASYNERLPSITETYGDGGLLLAQPELKKETALTNSVGLQGKGKCSVLDCRLYTAAFLTTTDDMITFIANSQRTMIAVNVGRVRAKGWETDLSLGYRHLLIASLKYTYLSAIDKGTIPFYRDKHLPFRPRHLLQGSLETGSKQLRYFLGGIWHGANFRDRYNSAQLFLEERFRMYSGLAWYFGKTKNYRLGFTIRNILDDRQVDVIGYSLPGRTYEINFTGKWDA